MAYGKLANKGRYGDTEIRNVAGRKSHVNKREASLIDLYGMLGQNLVQREGAGTRNPMTGMPEYHKKPWYQPGSKVHKAWHWTQDKIVDPISTGAESVGMMFEEMYDFATSSEDSTLGMDYSESGLTEQTTAILEDPGEIIPLVTGDLDAFEDEPMGPDIGENFDKEAYSKALAGGTQGEYLKSIGVPENKLEYFESNINMDELGFAQDRYSTGTQALGLQTGSSLGDIYSQTEQIQGSSGLESSGSIDFTKRQAEKGVMGDYLSQQQGLQTQLASTRSTFFQGATEEFWNNLTNMDEFG